MIDSPFWQAVAIEWWRICATISRHTVMVGGVSRREWIVPIVGA